MMMNRPEPHPPTPRAAGRELRILLATALWAWLLAGVAFAQGGGLHTQTLVLQPGWNAIFVEVAPEPFDFDHVFHGLPVQSVWAWFPPVGTVDFIDDPSQGLGGEGWRGWFPRPNPDAFLSEVFGLEANRAYLVQIGGSEPVALSISGRPVNLDLEWTPDSFNLVGLHVDPSSSPSFGSYLAASPAHAGQPIYRLDPTGTWERVATPFSTHIRSGEAYWIRTDGPSSYQGPLEVETELFDGMEYSAALDEQRLTIRNAGSATHQMRVRFLPSPTPIPFSRREIEAGGATYFEELAGDSYYDVASGQSLFLQLGVRRVDLAHDRSEQLLEITDGLGSRRLVFAGVSRVQPQESPAFALGGGVDPYAGLWVGEVAIRNVVEAHSDSLSDRPVGEPFRFRILLHVDAGGQVRLLDEVTQMWKEGTTRPDSENPELDVVDQPGRYVLITDPSLIPEYEGAALRDGVPVGLRISTVTYDLPEGPMPMTGSFGPTSNLQATLVVDVDAPTNPFRHSYHPDHDNLDEQFLGQETEAFQVIRYIYINFSPDHPTGRPPAGWGSNQLGGNYRENVQGLHRSILFSEGAFLLTRISAITELDG